MSTSEKSLIELVPRKITELLPEFSLMLTPLKTNMHPTPARKPFVLPKAAGRRRQPGGVGHRRHLDGRAAAVCAVEHP